MGSQTSSGGEQTIQGCLSQGANGFTLADASGTSYNLTGLAAGTTAYFRIRAINAAALRLFGAEGVVRVFLGSDFITITKSDAKDWSVLKPALLGVIMEHFTTNQPVLLDEAGATPHATTNEEDDEIVAQIKELLDTRVRPAVAQDGGDIIFHAFEDGVVYLHMQGSCSGCPSSTATLKMGIENMLRHYVPEVVEVRPV